MIMIGLTDPTPQDQTILKFRIGIPARLQPLRTHALPTLYPRANTRCGTDHR